MAAEQTYPSLRQIAKECHLSVAAVSMALRNHPRVSDETVKRVRAVADRINYRTNPLLHSVMSSVRSGVGRKAWFNSAFVWLEATSESVRVDEFQANTIKWVRHRAEQVGVRLDQFFLSDPGMTPSRLERVLIARGISGIIFSPMDHIAQVRLPLNWERFSVVVMGNTPWAPEFHRAAHNHYQGMLTALAELDRLGYCRPGAIMLENLNERARRAPEAAFLSHHPMRDRAQRMIFWTKRPKIGSDFDKWIARNKPDCLLFPFLQSYQPNVGGIHLRKRYPHAVLDIFSTTGVAGMHQDFEAIGANAIDLLMTQLLHNERGIPRSPKIVFAEGKWLNAPSLPPARRQMR